MTEPTPLWRVEFYETDEHECPVRGFLDRLGSAPRAKVLALIQLLAEEGPALPFPYSSQVRGKLRELRAQYGRENLRVLYFGAASREWVLLHGFTKRMPETPERETRVAEARMSEYLKRRRRAEP